MARDNSQPLLYEAGQRFVDAALRHDDSLFTPGHHIWSLPIIDDFYQRFVENADESPEDFETKLRRQLDGAAVGTVQLAAEIVFVNLLMPMNMGADKKHALVNKVLSWSPAPVTIPPDLVQALNGGIAHIGTGMTHRFEQLRYLLRVIRLWKGLQAKKQDEALQDPWAFKKVLDSIPLEGAGVQREAFLYLVFPDAFEQIVSSPDKQLIAERFAYLADPADGDIDKRLLRIRQQLVDKENFAKDFIFYGPGVKELWKNRKVIGPITGGTDEDHEPQPTDLLVELSDRLLLDRAYLARAERLLNDKGQLIFFGPPGTGKTFVARELGRLLSGARGGTVEVVQFHPSYAYEDFVEGYRPHLIDGQAGFDLVDGPLKRLARQARDNPAALHILLIDEINRGNIAKVFGELYYLLEYRDESISLQYSRQPFALPKNIWIIATMNSSDRSIALIDAALRRRFYFMPFFPDQPPVQGLLHRWLAAHKPDLLWLAAVVEDANKLLGDRQASIGPSYFLKDTLTEEWIELIWEHAVLPYVAEQFFGDEARVEQFRLRHLRKTTVAPTSKSDHQDEDEVADASPTAVD